MLSACVSVCVCGLCVYMYVCVHVHLCVCVQATTMIRNLFINSWASSINGGVIIGVIVFGIGGVCVCACVVGVLSTLFVCFWGV